MSSESLGESYFDAVYARSDDPWDFASSAYEREKYDATIALLGAARFERGFEIGCSIGVLTQRLAPRCERLLAIDINAKALAAARARNAATANVDFQKMAFPMDAPDGRFDLIVCSEVGYYWSDADLARAKEWFARSGAGGTLEMVHFLPAVPDYVRGGDAVHDYILADERFASIAHKRAERYRIDVCAIAAE